MNTLNDYVAEYIEYCEYRKRLDRKTLKAYRIDLKQYMDYLQNISEFYSKDNLDQYITHLHKQYKPKRQSFCLKRYLFTLYKHFSLPYTGKKNRPSQNINFAAAFGILL